MFAVVFLIAKGAHNPFAPLKFDCKDVHDGSTARRSFSRLHIVNLGRLVEEVRHVVVGVILIVQSEIDASRADVIEAGGGCTSNFG